MRIIIPIVFIIIFGDSCIDRLDYFSEETDSGTLVIDGNISNQPGPYTVKLFRVSQSTDNLNLATPAIARSVTLFDNEGRQEVLIDRGSGIYQTRDNGIQGKIGNEYWLKVELINGVSFESNPDKLLPIQEIDSLYFEWTTFQPQFAPTQYGFNVYVDGRLNSGDYSRLKFTGVYEVESFPKLNHALCNCCPEERRGPPDPYPCSGFTYDGISLKQVKPCDCCICWITDYEKKPNLMEDKFLASGNFKRVLAGYVPFDQWTFSKYKYLVKIEKMSLTKEAFEFWKVFEDQKNNGSSLFQPALARAKTNFVSNSTSAKVIGFFYSTAIVVKTIFITGEDAPISIPVPDIYPPETNCAQWRPCDAVFVNASRTPPPEWK